MTNRDVALAEALWQRSQQFMMQDRTQDALLDIMAAHRLFSLVSDPRVAQVYAQWTTYYQKSKLEGLLVQVNQRARKPSVL